MSCTLSIIELSKNTFSSRAAERKAKKKVPSFAEQSQNDSVLALLGTLKINICNLTSVTGTVRVSFKSLALLSVSHFPLDTLKRAKAQRDISFSKDYPRLHPFPFFHQYLAKTIPDESDMNTNSKNSFGP